MPEVVNTSALDIEDVQFDDDALETVIDVQDVSMVFNMASEQLNSLKEYAIQIARHKLFFEGFTALDHVSFKVKKGDVFGIVGTNGSGKSTMLKIVAGVLNPSEGTCSIKGNIAPLIELGAGFDQELSARENIYLNGALLGYSKEFIDQHFDEIVAFAEIERFLDMPLKNYSSGMTARIAFAVATVIVPDILIVDEVLSVGDFMFQRKCEDRIAALIQQHGTTVLIVSHSHDLIEKLCNKAIWIEKGHVRMLGDAKQVTAAYRMLGGRIGTPASEEMIFQTFRSGVLDKEELYESIWKESKGDDFFKMSSLAAQKYWSKSSNLVLTASATHINTVLAAGWAGALNAPMLVMSDGNLPDSTRQGIDALKPSNIIMFDANSHFEYQKQYLASTIDSPTITTFGHKVTEEFSYNILEAGAALNLWSDTIALIDFDNNTESFSIAPYLYASHSPAFITQKHLLPELERFASVLQNSGITRILTIGCMATEENITKLSEAGFEVIALCADTTQESCLKICTWVSSQFNEKTTSVGIGPMPIASWPELLSSAMTCGKNRWPLLLANTSNLDDIVSCMNYIRDRKANLSGAYFFGYSALSPGDRKLFASQLL